MEKKQDEHNNCDSTDKQNKDNDKKTIKQEKDLDKTLDDTFPASDPPATY